MILNHEMKVVACGNNLIETWSANNDNKHPDILIGSHITEFFKLRRPSGITLAFEVVRDVSSHRSAKHTNNFIRVYPLGHNIASCFVRNTNVAFQNFSSEQIY